MLVIPASFLKLILFWESRPLRQVEVYLCCRCLRSRSSASNDSVVLQTQKELGSFTKAEVAAHNSQKDCWIVVKGKVYDVSSYVQEHPGGLTILKNAGGDATEGFHGPQHPPRVFDIIDDFFIGDLLE